MIKVGVIGCGYWGPNLIRNFVMCPETELIWACDKDTKRMDKATRPYPGVKGTADINDILSDKNINAVAIATPVNKHFSIAKACLKTGNTCLLKNHWHRALKKVRTWFDLPETRACS